MEEKGKFLHGTLEVTIFRATMRKVSVPFKVSVIDHNLDVLILLILILVVFILYFPVYICKRKIYLCDNQD